MAHRNVVVDSGPPPRWWMWNPTTNRAVPAEIARITRRTASAKTFGAAAAALGVSAGGIGLLAGLTLATAGVAAAVPAAVLGIGFLVRSRHQAPEWEVASLAGPDAVVLGDEFNAAWDQRRFARQLCTWFLDVQNSQVNQEGLLDQHRLALIEQALWQVLVASRDNLPLRRLVSAGADRPALAGDIDEPARRLAGFDERTGRFAVALDTLADSVRAADVALFADREETRLSMEDLRLRAELRAITRQASDTGSAQAARSDRLSPKLAAVEAALTAAAASW